MNILKFLFRHARGLLILTGITAIISGACGIGLIALVNKVLSQQGKFTTATVIGFIAFGFGRVATTFVSQVFLAHFSQRAIADLRRNLVRKILAVPLREFEKIGAPRFMVALTEDVMEVGSALLMIPLTAVNASLLLGGAAYVSWLSWHVALGLCALIFFGAIVYRRFVGSGFNYLMLARDESDKLHGHFRAVTEGVKELKLHRERRGKFLAGDIQTVTENFSRHNVAAEIRFVAGQGWSQLLFIALIGLLLFLLPTMQNINPHTLTGYVLMALFLMGPIAGVLGSLSAFGRANVALQKIEKLGLSLDSRVTENCPLTKPEKNVRFAHLELRGITHSYHNEKDDSNFILGPMDLEFQPGELTFIVGGNGSGKSTLAKIIAGLYPPESGEVRLDGKLVGDHNRDDYRQVFSAVFADFFLFENLLADETEDLDAQARRYLAQLHLEHKVKVRDGKLSTIQLSQGQRKRLALLTAYLEDRPFYLFDEWASDQDPQFKEIFYAQLLPELKARGKAVVVITHDDKYFSFADRILKLDFGQLASEKQINGENANEEVDGKCFEPRQMPSEEIILQPTLES